MKKNTARLLFIAAIIVISVFIIFLQNFLKSFFNQNQKKIFIDLDKKNIQAIIIQDDKNKTNIFKDKNVWMLKKDKEIYPADQELINKIIDNFINLSKGEVVSNNKNKHPQFGIQQKNLTLKTKNKDYLLYIGNSTQLNSNYLRVDKNNEVFVGTGFNDIFITDDYRDLSVHFIDNEEDVGYVGIEFEGKKLTLTKKGNDWYSNEKKLKKERVDFLINDIKTLKANDILKKNPLENQWSPVFLTIKVSEKGSSKTAEFFAKDKDNYYLKTSNSPFFFQISSVYVTSFEKEEKDFTE